MTTDFNHIIQTALEFMQAHAAEDLSVNSIGKSIGYSGSWLQQIFIAHTGEAVFTHLMRIRIEKAKVLLAQTDLSISEIGFEVGFNSHTRFGSAFRKKTGATPRAYRKQQKAKTQKEEHVQSSPTKQGTTWHTDTFKGNALSQWWEPVNGNWLVQDNILEGSGREYATLVLNRFLPENFTASFDCQPLTHPGPGLSHFMLMLLDRKTPALYCGLAMGFDDSPANFVNRFDARVGTNTAFSLQKDIWQHVELSLVDNSIQVSVNGVEALAFRDPFPPPYARRCRLAFEVWYGSIRIRIRNFVVRDRGFLTLARPVRQGDALYNAGLYAQAAEFYLRLHASGRGDKEELEYKIGSCRFFEGEYDQAQEWLEKVVEFPESNFWAQHASIALLETTWKQGRKDAFCEQIPMLYAKPSLKERVYAMTKGICADLNSWGFYEQSLGLQRALYSQERKGEPSFDDLLDDMGNTLVLLNRFESAAECFRESIESTNSLHKSMKTTCIFSLSDCLYHLGDFDGAMQSLEQIRKAGMDIATEARIMTYQVFVLRAQGKFAEALAKVAAVSEKYPMVLNWRVFSLLTASHIHCGLNQPAAAREKVSEAIELDPKEWALLPGRKSRFFYPPLLLEGTPALAAELLVEDARTPMIEPALQAEHMIKAGMLYELAGQAERANDVWTEAAKRYPVTRCHYWALIADGLQRQNEIVLDGLPYPVRTRTELFYLAGLLCEKRGDAARAKEWFGKSARENAAGEWPGVLAASRL